MDLNSLINISSELRDELFVQKDEGDRDKIIQLKDSFNNKLNDVNTSITKTNKKYVKQNDMQSNEVLLF